MVFEAERVVSDVSDLDCMQHPCLKAEQFRGINYQKDTAFVNDMTFRRIALAFNCDYMTFYRTDAHIGRKFLKIDLAAMICAQSAKEVDNLLIQWCYYRDVHLPSRHWRRQIGPMRRHNHCWTGSDGGRVERRLQRRRINDRTFQHNLYYVGIAWRLHSQSRILVRIVRGTIA